MEGGDGGPPKPLERFGWPTESPTESPAAGKKMNGVDVQTSRLINRKDRKAEKVATERPAETESSKKIETREVKNLGGKVKNEPWVKVEEDMGTFSQSITERLAFLEEDEGGEADGGVKLPVVTGGKDALRGW